MPFAPQLQNFLAFSVYPFPVCPPRPGAPGGLAGGRGLAGPPFPGKRACSHRLPAPRKDGFSGGGPCGGGVLPLVCPAGWLPPRGPAGRAADPPLLRLCRGGRAGPGAAGKSQGGPGQLYRVPGAPGGIPPPDDPSFRGGLGWLPELLPGGPGRGAPPGLCPKRRCPYGGAGV